MTINGFTLLNKGKVERALEGNMMNDGEYRGGVLHGDEFDEKKHGMALLAEYDRLGGCIVDDEKSELKTGSFYNFKKKQAHDKPQIVRVFRINGEIVEVVDGDKTPRIVEAQKQVEEGKAAIKKEKKERKGKK